MNRASERGSPANLDAEAGLIGSCLIDESQSVIATALSLDITPLSFFSPRHQVLFEAIASLHSAKSGIDEITVAEWLHSRGQLEAVGGHAEINAIGNRVETTAHSRFWIEIVKEKEIARRSISEATTAVERIYRGDDIANVLESASMSLADLAGKAGGKRDTKGEQLAQLLQSRRFDMANPPPTPIPIVSLCGKTIFTEGNISAFIAGKSSGKTSSVTAIIASMIGPKSYDYLGFLGDNPHGKSVLYFDTEQSQFDFHQMQRRIMWRARVDSLPPWVEPYHLKPFKTLDRRKMVMDRIKAATKERGCLMAIIDGAVDLVTNFNDIAECNDFMDELMEVTDSTKAHVHCTLHVNPGQKRNEHQDKARGHLGTFLEQRSEVVLLSTKKRVQNVEEMVIDTKDARHGILHNPPRIRWNDSYKMLMTYSVEAQEADEDRASMGKLATVLAMCYDGLVEHLTYSELVSGLAKAGGWTPATAKNRVTEMKRLGLVTEVNGLYSRA